MHSHSTKELLAFIQESIKLIEKRFSTIKSSDDFMEDEGMDKLDAISMRLQSIGEALKNLDKREKEFLLLVADEEYWSQIIKTRDFISRHYIDIDAEVVYDICKNELHELKDKIDTLYKNL